MELKILTLQDGPLDVNTYFLHLEGCADTIVVDPGDATATKKFLAQNNLVPVAVLLTHGHFDHICGVYDIQKMGAQVYVHSKDADCLENPLRSMAHFVRLRQTPTRADFFVEDGDRMKIAGIDIDVLHTPGHTEGGVVYKIENEKILLSGDTLFRDVYGNTEFDDGDVRKIYHSIVDKLFSLDGDYTVYPGHGEITTLSYERKHNAILLRSDVK